MSLADGELVRAVAFSPDGTTLAAALGDEAGTIELFDVTNGRPIRMLVGHSSIVWGLAFAPDGSMLASAARDKTAKVWDWRNGSLQASLDFPNEVVSVAFSTDSRTMAVGGVEEWPNAAIWTYSVGSWQPVMRLAEFWNIPDIAFSPDDTLLAGGGTSRNVRVWGVTDGEVRHILYHPGQVSSLAISPDGSILATGLCELSQDNECTRGAVWEWDLNTGILMRKLSDFADGVVGVAFSPDGTVVLGASRGGNVRAYSVPDYRPLLDVVVPSASSPIVLLSMAVSSDGRLVATGGIGKIDLWRVEP
jgi:WD40 repeat protein